MNSAIAVLLALVSVAFAASRFGNANLAVNLATTDTTPFPGKPTTAAPITKPTPAPPITKPKPAAQTTTTPASKTTPTPAPGFGSYFSYNNTRYFYSCTNGDDFFSAHFSCAGFGYKLVQIENEYLNSALQAVAGFGESKDCTCKSAPIWIGLVYESESSRYVWSGDGSPLGAYHNFAGPTNHTEGTNCVFLDVGTGKWNMQRCDTKDLNFLCQSQ